MALTDEERAAIAAQLDDLYRLVDDLAASARRRLNRVADAIGERRP